MGYLEYNRSQLINLEYSLDKEFIRTNRAGSYASSTIINCNTRKYHGLLVTPLDHIDGGWHVLLSALDETIIHQDDEFHLATRKFSDFYHSGHQYLIDFKTDPIPAVIYQVGNVTLKKEMLLVSKQQTLLVRYTLLEAPSDVTIKVQPFLAFRNIHILGEYNSNINKQSYVVNNGVKIKLYEPYPYIYLQTSKKSDYKIAPDWYYAIEYSKEQERGYDYKEDQYVPGYFNINLEKGKEVVFSASTSDCGNLDLKTLFNSEIENRIPRISYNNCLRNAAEQFISINNKKLEIIQSYHFLNRNIRKALIALPGLTLPWGNVGEFKNILDEISKSHIKGTLSFGDIERNSFSDTPTTFLWYLTALQHLQSLSTQEEVWGKYRKIIKQLFVVLKKGNHSNVTLEANGLLRFHNENVAQTWMDSTIEGKAILHRSGYAVEVNALWYNAMVFVLQLAQKANDQKFLKEWRDFDQTIERSFRDTFWDSNKRYLADTVFNGIKDWSVRPNQIFAAALPNSPLNIEQIKSVVDIVKSELLTKRGLRTLSPKNENYVGICTGSIDSREFAMHNGSAWPWLLGYFSEAYLKIHNTKGLDFVKKIYANFEEEMHNNGIGTLSEYYDGNPDYKANGAISDAGAIAEISRIKMIIDKYR